MNSRTQKKLDNARRMHSSNRRNVMAAYRIAGYDEDTKTYIAFNGVIKLSKSTVGTLFRRHKKLAALSKIRLTMHPM